MKTRNRIFLKLFALLVCTLPVTIATLSYFPVWKNRGSGAVLSGFTVLILIICFYPTVRAVKKLLTSPSVFGVWLFLFIIFSLIKSIVFEITVISFVGMISNLLGSLIYKLSEREARQ